VLIHLDSRSDAPLFEQVVFAVKAAVARGDAAPGDRLPSVRDLARDLSINPNTVVRAYEVLERDGVVVRRQGSGCFVSDRGSDLAAGERQRQLFELLRKAVTEAFHLGFRIEDVTKALEQCLQEYDFDGKKRKS
jgi:GntR family transcriptional regulator